jgi:hypothetical protein
LSAKPVKGTRNVYEKIDLKIDLMRKIPFFFPCHGTLCMVKPLEEGILKMSTLQLHIEGRLFQELLAPLGIPLIF